MTSNTASSPWEARRASLGLAVEAVLRSYARVLFARSPAVGLVLLAATFTVPRVGALGLLGVVLAAGISALLQLDREALREGLLGYNALLVFLALGATLELSPAFWVVAGAAALLVVLVHVALSGAMAYHLRLPVLSLPFVFVTWLLMAATPHVRGMGFQPRPAALDLGVFPGPELVDTFLRSLGAIFFLPYWVPGALVLVALVVYSRIATVHALIGFGIAVLADRYLFAFPKDFVHQYVGFNFLLTAVALGGIYYVPGPASLLLASASTVACGLVSVGLVTWLQPVGASVLALPLNLTVLTVVYALNQRQRDASPRSVEVPAGSPEEHLDHYRTRVERFRTSLPIWLQLPFRGAWVCTQGNDGAHTHQGLWRHGLDFEVADAEGKRFKGDGSQTEDWLCWRLPVLAPAPGTVVRVVSNVVDNAVGKVDTEQAWGNVVVIQHAPEVFSILAHMAQDSARVTLGDVVSAGQVVGLCGASGRSPVPHLHVQLQATSHLGAPTRPIAFHGAITARVEANSLAIERCPAEGERVRNIARDDALAAAFAWTPGQRYLLRTTIDGKSREDEVFSELDLLGNRSLWCPSRRARLWFESHGDAFVAYAHVGPGDDPLLPLYCALSKVPYDEADGLTWDDYLDPRRLGSSAIAWLADAVRAFVPTPHLRTTYSVRRRGGLVTITGEGGQGQRFVPEVRTEAIVRLGIGVERVIAKIGKRTMEVTWLEIA